MLKLYYGIQNSIRICRRGVVAAYHVVWECVVEQWLGVRRMLSNKRLPLPQFLIICHHIRYNIRPSPGPISFLEMAVIDIKKFNTPCIKLKHLEHLGQAVTFCIKTNNN